MQVGTAPTVAEIAARSLAAVRVFERYGIDYCCGGQRPLAEACAAKGIDSLTLEWELQEAMAEAPAGERNWPGAPLAELIRHIVDTHHGYLRRELPAISRRLEKVYRVYNRQYGPTLTGLPETFLLFERTLYEHMGQEEAELFRAVEACDLSGGKEPSNWCTRLRDPGALQSLRAEHEETGRLLARIRAITEDFRVPSHGCVTYRALMSGLREMEQDLHVHIHLENNILFPRIAQLAVTAS